MPEPPATIRKAVIPAAGLGTRLLPVTRAVPKELLPIVDTPVLQLVVEEAVASGIDDLLIVTGHGKEAIETLFAGRPDLDDVLRRAGRDDVLARLRRIRDRCRIHFVLQPEPRGLGDAVRYARAHVGDEPFAVLLGDAVIDPHPGCPPGLAQLVAAHAATGASVVGVERVPPERVHRYGIVDVEPPLPATPDLRRVRGLVEKPDAGRAPSDLAIAARYVLDARVFAHLDEAAPGAGGEVQLTDAIDRLARARPVYARVLDARRYDVGAPADYVRCFVDFARRRPDVAAAVEPGAERIE